MSTMPFPRTPHAPRACGRCRAVPRVRIGKAFGNVVYFTEAGGGASAQGAAGAMLPSNGDDYIFHIPSLPVWIVDSACYCNYTAFS